MGSTKVSNELKKRGVFISPSGVRSVWLRNNIETFSKRLKRLEKLSAEEGLVLTEAQVAAIEKAKEEKFAIGEIETYHPAYLGAGGYLLCRNDKRCWPYLSADLYRYLL